MEKYLNEKHGKVQEAEQTVEVKQEVSETPVKKRIHISGTEPGTK